MKLTIFKISNGARVADGKLPDELKLLNWGDNPAIKGLNPKLGHHSISKFGTSMLELGLDRVALDFEHNTVPGSPAFEASPEPRAVAAYGVPELRVDDGLYLTSIIYTPHGESHALDYFDISPTVHIDDVTGEVDLLHSAALTRAGAVKGLSFYNVESNVETKKQGDNQMDWRALMLGFTGASEDVSDEDLAAAFTGKIDAMAAATETVTALSAEVATMKLAAEKTITEKVDEDGLTATVTALSASLVELKDEMKEMHSDGVKRDRLVILSAAAQAGKVIPLSVEQIAKTDPVVLQDMVSKLPATVPVDQRTPENLQALSADTATASSALSAVSALCGSDLAKVIEANK